MGLGLLVTQTRASGIRTERICLSIAFYRAGRAAGRTTPARPPKGRPAQSVSVPPGPRQHARRAGAGAHAAEAVHRHQWPLGGSAGWRVGVGQLDLTQFKAFQRTFQTVREAWRGLRGRSRAVRRQNGDGVPGFFALAPACLLVEDRCSSALHWAGFLLEDCRINTPHWTCRLTICGRALRPVARIWPNCGLLAAPLRQFCPRFSATPSSSLTLLRRHLETPGAFELPLVHLGSTRPSYRISGVATVAG